MRFQVIIFLLISFHLNTQKNIPFSGSIYSSPRFIEDSLLTGYKSKKVFKIKIKKNILEKLKNYKENPFKKDSIKRGLFKFRIDSTGIAKYKDEYT